MFLSRFFTIAIQPTIFPFSSLKGTDIFLTSLPKTSLLIFFFIIFPVFIASKSPPWLLMKSPALTLNPNFSVPSIFIYFSLSHTDTNISSEKK